MAIGTSGTALDMQEDNNGKKPIQIEEIVSSIKTIISNLSEQLKEYTQTLKTVSNHQTEMYKSIGSLFDNLNFLLFGNNSTPDPADHYIKKQTDYILNGSRYSKDEIISMMRSMRKDGATLSEIADYLKEKGVPTFSGRGEWHAQTVHRLVK